MEPLTIICDTCNSRVRVRNPALLGQLVNCPKCASMVLVAPPGTVTTPSPASAGPRETQIEVQRHGRPAVDSAALTQEGLPAELIGSAAMSPAASTPVDESGDEYRLAPEISDAEVTDSSSDASEPVPPPIQHAAPHTAQADVRTADSDVPAVWGDDAPPHLPSADWTSDATTKTRQMLLVGFLGFAGVLLAALVFVGFLRWYANGDANEVDNSATVAAAASQDSAPAQPEDNSTNELVAGDPTSPELADDDGTDPNQPVTNLPDAISTVGENSLAVNDPALSPAGDFGSNGITPSEVPADLAPVASDDSVGNPGDENPSLDSTANTEESGDAQPAATLPKQLQAFGPMLQYEIQPQFSDAMEILSEAPVTAEDLGLTASTETVALPSVDLQSQTQIVIPAMVIGDLPLSQFVSLWSNLSGIPTTVDLASLTAAGIDRNQTIGLAMVKSVTLGSLADQLGAPLGLQTVPHDNSFLALVAPTAAIEEHLPEDISLAGLVEADQEIWLLETLPQLFPQLAVGLTSADSPDSADSVEASDASQSPAPPEPSGEFDALADSMSAAEAEISESSSAEATSTEALVWKIEQGRLLRPQTTSGGAVDPRIWSSAVYLLEGWRHAAGLPTSLANFDPALHSARLVAPSEVAGLDFVLQQVQAEARPVAQVLPSICQAAGLQAWMDWPGLTSLGLSPNSTALVLTSSRPLRRALADYASKFSLVVAVLDNQSLWITSNHAYRTSPRLYVIPSQDESVEAWTSRLRPLTPVAPNGFGVGQVVVIPTPDKKFMLVRCCPMQIAFQ